MYLNIRPYAVDAENEEKHPSNGGSVDTTVKLSEPVEYFQNDATMKAEENTRRFLYTSNRDVGAIETKIAELEGKLQDNQHLDECYRGLQELKAKLQSFDERIDASDGMKEITRLFDKCYLHLDELKVKENSHDEEIATSESQPKRDSVIDKVYLRLNIALTKISDYFTKSNKEEEVKKLEEKSRKESILPIEAVPVIELRRLPVMVKYFTCSVCLDIYGSTHDLKKHRFVHDPKPYKCDVCDRAYSRKYHLKIHKYSHTEKPFKCDRDNCSFTAPTEYLLKQHQMIHDNAKPFSCDVCSYRGNRKHNLLLHMQTHSSEKRFKCNECDDSFASVNVLKRHVMTHVLAKPYECDMCNYATKQSSNLTRHKKCRHAI